MRLRVAHFATAGIDPYYTIGYRIGPGACLYGLEPAGYSESAVNSGSAPRWPAMPRLFSCRQDGGVIIRVSLTQAAEQESKTRASTPGKRPVGN